MKRRKLVSLVSECAYVGADREPYGTGWMLLAIGWVGVFCGVSAWLTRLRFPRTRTCPP